MAARRCQAARRNRENVSHWIQKFRSKLAQYRVAVGRARQLGLFAALTAAIFYFGNVVHGHYPMQHWLFWRYAAYWASCALLSLACLSLGNLMVRGMLRRPLPLLEHVVVSLAAGLFGFEVLMFFAGLAQLFHPALFVVLPLALIALGFRSLWPMLRRARRHIVEARRHAAPLPWWALAIVAFGLLGLLMVYFPIITPENMQFDSRWKHVALAEEFAVAGGIRRFDIGLTFATRPHFTSFLYTWAFLLPKGQLFDHIELCGHLEFTVFLWTTLLGIPAVVRRLVPGADVRLVWVARFLFPGVWLYDSSLTIGADHIGAFFFVPVFLLLYRTWHELQPRHAALLGLMLSAGTLVKYSIAIMVVPGAVAAVGVRVVQFAVRASRGKLQPHLRRNWYLTPLVATAACLIFTAPLWAHNFVWYGNPFYPLAHEYFWPRPWTADAAYMLEWGYKKYQFWRPTRDLDGVIETLKVLFSWSFKPHDWGRFHGKVPVIGSLFTLSLACLPFLKKTKRIWLTALWVHAAIFAWYWVHHQDRYLQALMPWMASCTAAAIVLVWRQGRHVVRATLLGLLGLQVVWGGDVFFIPGHAMIKSPIKVTAALLAKGHKRKYEQRYNTQTGWVAVGRALPKDARVLLHENHVHLGIGRVSISDWGSYQYGLSYGLLESPREVYEALRRLGVTHLHFKDTSRSWDSLAGDIMFYDFALHRATPMKKIGGGRLAKMPDKPPPNSWGDQVALLGCGKPYRSGLYRVSDLRAPTFGPLAKKTPAPSTLASSTKHAVELAGKADIVVVDPACGSRFSGDWRRGKTRAFKRKRVPKLRNAQYEIYFGPRPR